MVKPFAVLVVLGFVTLTACGTESAGHRTVATHGDVAQRLDSAAVPADLRHLVSLAERWGIGDDVDRNDKVQRATAAEREELRSAITPLYARITTWLDSFGGGAMSDEAAAFMYMQLALEEMLATSPG